MGEKGQGEDPRRGSQHSRPSIWVRARAFITEDIWRPDEETPRLSWGARLFRRVTRVVYCTVRGFRSQRRTFHAAALTYFSALSIVPCLAFSFAVVKGLGGYWALVQNVIRPWIGQTFPGNEPLQKAVDQLLGFVRRTNVTTLGAVGFVTLAYGAVSLLSTIERAFNDIWGVAQSRPLLRRTTNYITLVVLTPILALAGASLTTAAGSTALMERFEALPAIGTVIRLAFHLSSLGIMTAAFAALYLIIPNTRVRVSAALTGALVGGVLWQLALILQVNSQRAIASYNALYLGFSAIPIFFVWMYVSWTIVLVGAELASSYQQEATIRQRRRARDADQGFRERLALQIMSEVAGAFLGRRHRWTVESLACELHAPVQVTAEIVTDLARADLLLLVGDGESPHVAVSTDVDRVHVTDILRACRHRTHATGDTPPLERELCAPAGSVADKLEAEAERSEQNISVRELANLVHGAEAASASSQTHH